MYSSNVDSKQYFINEVSVNSHETYDMYQRLTDTFLDKSYDIRKSWELLKAVTIQNPKFEQEFEDKSKEFAVKTSYPEHYEVRYGFLATIKEKMIEKVASDGLEVKMCPYNYLGYNIAGIHISQYADICLTEARSKIVPGNELILICFQYMLGKRKIVAMHDPKNLLAPTPKFDSHICEERPDPKEKDTLQYTKSLVYLYEFANGNLDPVTRPRHCCPIAAMVFKNCPAYESLDLTGPPDHGNVFGSYESPLSFLKPISKRNQPVIWNRPYSTSEFKSSEEDSRKLLSPQMEKELYNIEDPTTGDDSWRSVNYGQQYQSEGSRDLMFASKGGLSRNGDSMILKPVDRDRSPERSKNWGESNSSRGSSSRSSRLGFESSRRTSGRGSKNWFK